MLQSDLKKEVTRLREKRAYDWKVFRMNHLFTQKRLAEIIGISRRTLQKIEGARITPHPKTLRRFEQFKQKYDRNAELS